MSPGWLSRLAPRTVQAPPSPLGAPEPGVGPLMAVGKLPVP
jgi:hypothetical protein